jgi:hypothetical protein
MIATTHRRDALLPRRTTKDTGFRYDRPTDVLAVLQHARAIVETGWVQNRWVATAPHRARSVEPRSAARPVGTADATPRACLVAAVALAVRDRDPRADLAVSTGPALAAVWDAVQDDPRLRPATGRAAPHEVRVARMRELARWNDRPGRTRDDVVAVLDGAAARVVAATVEPARA